MSNDILDGRMGPQTQVMPNTFISNIFTYMFGALLVTAAVAWFGYESEFYFRLYNETGSFNGLGYIVMFAPLAIVLVMQMAYHRFSVPVLLLLFAGYSALLGLSLSSIFAIFTSTSIALTFVITAGMFGGMALLGYTTKTDLTKFGSILMMAFWGIFIAAIVNFFLGSETLDFIISGIGVLVFTGLTAYKLQYFKRMGSDPTLAGTEKSKLAIIGGLQLYILFVNLFLSLLRFFGSRD